MRERAIALWREAYRRQMAGDLDGAIETYRRSIEVCPTAEAHTFLGWTYSFQGRLEDRRFVTGTETIDGRDWTVYAEEGSEPLWVSDFGDVRILIGGSGDAAEFATIAAAANAAEPLTP